MTLIVSDGSGTHKVPQKAYKDEKQLQEYIADHPESIPLYEIEDDIAVAVAVKEFTVDGEYIDALAFDQNGKVYILETKLDQNTDKRQVIAQTFDYGAALWDHTDPLDFLAQLDEKIEGYDSFREWASDELELESNEYEVFRQNVIDRLRSGNLTFVIVMDEIEDRLKSLIKYLNANSSFELYGVELYYYEYDGAKIVVPSLYGTEVKSSTGYGKASSGSSSSDKHYSKQKSLYDQFEEAFKEKIDDPSRVEFAGKSGYRQVRLKTIPSKIHLEWNFEVKKNRLAVRADFEYEPEINKSLLREFEERHLSTYEQNLGEEIETHVSRSWARFYIARQTTVPSAANDAELQEWAVEKMTTLFELFQQDIESALESVEDDLSTQEA